MVRKYKWINMAMINLIEAVNLMEEGETCSSNNLTYRIIDNKLKYACGKKWYNSDKSILELCKSEWKYVGDKLI